MKRPTLVLSALLISLPACGSGESGSPDDDTTTGATDDTGDTTGETGDGDGDTTDTSGDGDGDTTDTTGDGDGDTTGGDGDASLGEMIWVDDGHQSRCGGCHYSAGQDPPPVLAGPLTYAEILDQIVNGGGYMPPQVPDEMTMQDAQHIAAYLETL